MTSVSGHIDIQGNQLTFTPDTPFPKNKRVLVRIRQTVPSDSGIVLPSDIEFSFVTDLDPFYSKVRDVRSAVGEFIDEKSDEELAILIYQSSLHADQVAARPYGSVNDWFPGERRSQSTNEPFFHDFVLYDAAVKALLSQTTGHMSSRSEQIQVGPIATRDAGSMVPEMNMVLKRLESRRKEALNLLTMGVGTFSTISGDRSFGGSYPYPHRNEWRRLN